MNINIITPCSRVSNLEIVKKSIVDNLISEVNVRWHIVIDNKVEREWREKFNLNDSPHEEYVCKEENNLSIYYYISDKDVNAIAGHAHRNFILDKLENEVNKNDWVYNLDDDNVIFPNFFRYVYSLISVTERIKNEYSNDERVRDINGIIFSQLNRDNSIRLTADKNNIKVCHVDTAMFIFKMSILNKLRFIENDYCADGHFIEKLYNNNRDNILVDDEPHCYYNYIEKGSKMNINGCPVTILQNEWEFKNLLDIYKTLRPKNILEIGTFFGGTLWHWLKYDTDKKIEKMICLDYPVPSSDDRYEEMIQSKQKWNDWLKDSNKDIFFFLISEDSKSPEAYKKIESIFRNKDIDLLFIDGGHDYETVSSDFEKYSPFVRKNGLIVFHDVVGCGEVKDYWNKIKNNFRYIEIFNGTENGMGIGIITK